MLSLYIHIPFCAHKCSYCSFFVLPENEENVDRNTLEQMKTTYLQALIEESKNRHKQYGSESIKSIYIGGGTPFQLGSKKLLELIDHILGQRDCEFLEELTIELNPDPFDEVLSFIKEAGEKYKHLYRLRFSLGIQSFDDEILKGSKRNYLFNNLISFLREMQACKKPNMSFSGDFIAFGKFNTAPDGEKILRNPLKLEFFINMVNSLTFDGFSLYTLELFPGSDWRNEQKNIAKHAQKQRGTDEDIMDEFHLLRKFMQHAGYNRYEISNFALAGKQSIHNLVYWEGGSYLGLGINASSYLNKKTQAKCGLPVGFEKKNNAGVRFKNTHQRKSYLEKEDKTDTTSCEFLDEKERLREEAILKLRTTGIKDINQYTSLFVPGRENLLKVWDDEHIVSYKDGHLSLKSKGYDLYNTIVTQLFT